MTACFGNIDGATLSKKHMQTAETVSAMLKSSSCNIIYFVGQKKDVCQISWVETVPKCDYTDNVPWQWEAAQTIIPAINKIITVPAYRPSV